MPYDRYPDARSKYNVLCKPCNALHYVQDILKIPGHHISWDRSVASFKRILLQQGPDKESIG